MKLEDQIVSLELAEKLKELGFIQESLWVWAYDDEDKEWCILLTAQLEEYPEQYPYQEMNIFSAYTVAELFNLIDFDVNWMMLSIDPVNKKWALSFKEEVIKGENLADCLAGIVIKNYVQESKDKN